MSMTSASAPQGDIEPLKLFVGGLSWETTKESLQKYFEKFGTVTDSVIMIDPNTKKPRGFGFVSFQDMSSVQKVLTTPKHEHIIDTKQVDPKPATTKQSEGQKVPMKIFIGGLPQGVTDAEIKAFFMKHGNVTDVDLKYDKATDRMRGFGFVGFDSEEAVDALVQQQYVTINQKRVEIKRAEPRYYANAASGRQMPGHFQQQQYNGAGYARGQASYAATGQYSAYPPYNSYGHGTNQYGTNPYAYNYQSGQYAYPGQYGGARGDYPAYNQTQTSSGGSQQMATYNQTVDPQTTAYQTSGRTNYGTTSDGYPNQGYSYETGYTQQQYDTSQGGSYGRGNQQRNFYGGR